MHNDAVYMARAVELAWLGRFTTSPNPNVGCVIVRDGIIVGEGYHQRAGEPHAEVHALRAAGEKARGATAYVTLEPCSHHGRTPPCADALIEAGIARVVAAMQDPNPEVAGRGLYRLQQAGIEVEYGLMMEEAEALNRGFFKRMRTGFPYFQLKMAASLDGKTAMASGESQWITSNEARRDVQAYRAQSCAILSTSETVLADNPSLNVRWEELGDDVQAVYPKERLRQPLRVILDARNRLTPDLKAFSLPGPILLVRTQKGNEAWSDNVEQLIVPAASGGVDLVVLMMQLGRRQINRVWTEAGATLAGALLTQGLVDELVLYTAPKLLGDDARGLCRLPGIERLADAPRFTFGDVKRVGDDLRLSLFPNSER
ncbi:bifunctional diaminohydroxyphosphoribosylaminopyrimidine deaminase/5-amino-6-(5-phosphoribosylamino)uracil reductase RibD [Leminorella grimontii]|uniref:bifunctional diaminohydroxyphosphoribosylaminopyrimidine deaminase/5-amino-6-(5-phosphoribosylamino)uracil reductase RibD n=1 Tax=Leminorella grimontii TaxID=82981 RepID=UPI00321FF1F9